MMRTYKPVDGKSQARTYSQDYLTRAVQRVQAGESMTNVVRCVRRRFPAEPSGIMSQVLEGEPGQLQGGQLLCCHRRNSPLPNTWLH